MLLDKSIPELAKLLEEEKITSVDLVEEAYATIEKLDKKLKAFITLRKKNEVIKEARQKDSNRKNEESILYGLPYSIKDSFNTKNIRTTAGSKVLDNFISPNSSTVYEKLEKAGAILIGKNNLDAWGHGGSTENTDYGVGRNPWNFERIAGGSSGGPAIATSTRMVSFAIGEDTGGSIRNPASMCNISGLKVSYGRVSRLGSIAYASSLDSVGPMAKSVVDLACILEHIAGLDEKDATSSQKNIEPYYKLLEEFNIKNKIIGIPKELMSEGIHPEVKSIVKNSIKVFEKLGAKIVEVSIPYLKYGTSIYYLIALSETSSNMARYDGVRYGKSRDLLSSETKRRILLGTYSLSAGYADDYYIKAQKARTVLVDEFKKAFESCDVLLGPVTPNSASKIGELINNPLQSYLEDLYTGPVSVVGVPSLAIPAGFTKNNLPVGIQLIGKKFHEKELFQFGHAFQKKTDWHKQKPPVLK